jgi:hypothetical protein
MALLISSSPTEEPPCTPSTRNRYLQAGHAKKLVPIIASLDRYDNDATAWQPLKESVELMTTGWDDLIRTCENERARTLLNAQRDLCFEALRVQSDLFHAHRQTCVRALKLQRG